MKYLKIHEWNAILTTYFLALVTATPCWGGTRMVIDIPKAHHSIKLDGIISDGEWEGASFHENFVEVSPGENIPADVKTICMLAYDDRYLYIGFQCFEPDVARMRTSSRKRDQFTLSMEDQVIITFDPLSTGKGGYVLIINPSGVQMDMYFKWDTGEADPGVDLIWHSATRIHADCWCAEIAIPFTSIEKRSDTIQQWLLDITRVRPRDNDYFYSWRATPKGESEYVNMPIIRFERSKLTKKHSVFPFFAASHEKRAHNWDTRADIGITGKFLANPNLTMALAVNPDYSQIESDALEIDINTRLAIYYPEKRPFFLERKEFFEALIPVVFTRSINDPKLAFKLMGNARNLEIGYVAAIDRHSPLIIPLSDQTVTLGTDMESFSNIVRLRYRLSQGTLLGALFTGRNMDSGYNRTVGIDSRIELTDQYYLSSQWIRSLTKEPYDTVLLKEYSGMSFDDRTVSFDGEKFTGDAFHLEFKRAARHINVDLSYRSLSPAFRADNGFIQANDSKDANLRVTVSAYNLSSEIKRVSFTAGYKREVTYGDLHKENNLVSILKVDLSRQNFLTVSYQNGSKSYKGYKLNGVWNASFAWLNSTVQQLAVLSCCTYGKDIDYFAYPPVLGKVLNATTRLELRPTHKLELVVSGSRYILWAEDIKSPAYDMITLDAKAAISPVNHLNLRTIVQYSRSVASYMHEPHKKVIVAPLVSYELTPFDLFYIGSNFTYGKTEGTYHSQHPRYFIKLQHEFDF